MIKQLLYNFSLLTDISIFSQLVVFLTRFFFFIAKLFMHNKIAFPKLAFVFQKDSTKRLILLAISLIPALLFLPFPDSITDIGIDNSLSFIFSYIMQGHLALGKDIIFPHGPFAFIMYPLPGNSLWWIAMSFSILVRVAWAYSFLSLVSNKSWRYHIVAFIGCLMLSTIVGLLGTIVQMVIMFLLHYLETRKLYWLVPPLVLTAFAFFIKAFVGILCLSVIFPFFLILLYLVIKKEENPWRLVYILIVPLSIAAIWMVLYGTSHGLLRYAIGMQQLASDNSAAAALYPDNLWIWLIIGLLAGFILMITNLRNRKQLQFFILILPMLFAIWKYGMARQDYYHALTIIIFLFFVLLIFLLQAERFKVYHLVLSLIVFVAFAINFANIRGPENSFSPPTNGFLKLISAAMDYQYFSDTCEMASQRNVKRNLLCTEIRSMIGNKTVDIYPWNYSYLKANNFNWQPRPVLHSYASYTYWLDDLNVKHFESKSAPEFIIWELKADSRDAYGGDMESIDGRYLLNDEPETMLSLVSYYRLLAMQEGKHSALIYAKRQAKLEFKTKEISKIETIWNTWFNVPDTAIGLLRASVHTKLTFAGKLKGMFYKDDDVYAYYMFSDGDIRRYRVVPRTMDYGLWINPLVMNPELHMNEPRIIKMCFRSRNENLMYKKISITFSQTIPVGNSLHETDSSGFVFDFFGLKIGKKRETLLKRGFAMDSVPMAWTHPIYSTNHRPDSINSLELLADQYSPAFTINLDSLQAVERFTDGLVLSQVWMKSGDKANAGLIVALDRGEENILWKSADLKYAKLNENDYNLISSFLDLDEFMKKEKGLTLKVYLWNFGKEPVYWKNFSIHIKSILP